MDRYRISQDAERAGMPATTLRHDDGRGPVPLRRSASGYVRDPLPRELLG